MPIHNTPDPQRAGFARTNQQTIGQRATLLCELLPETHSIVELCCGDCTAQWEIYCAALPGLTFGSLDAARAEAEARRDTFAHQLLETAPAATAGGCRRQLGRTSRVVGEGQSRITLGQHAAQQPPVELAELSRP